MFSKCLAHGVWLSVPGKPASGLGRSSQLRTRQGACAGKDKPRHRLAFGSVYLGLYTGNQGPLHQECTFTPPGSSRLTTGAPTAQVRQSERKQVPSRTTATLHLGWGLPRPLRVSACNPCVHRKGKAWPGRLAQRGWFQKPAELTLHQPTALRYQRNQGCVCRLRHKRGVSEASVAQSRPTLCDLVDCSPPGSSVHGSLQARTLQRVAVPSSRGSSRHRD